MSEDGQNGLSYNPERNCVTLFFPEKSPTRSSAMPLQQQQQNRPDRPGRSDWADIFGFSSGSNRIAEKRKATDLVDLTKKRKLTNISPKRCGVIPVILDDNSTSSDEDFYRRSRKHPNKHARSSVFGSNDLWNVQAKRNRSPETSEKLCCNEVEKLYYQHYLRYINDNKVGPTPCQKDYTNPASVIKMNHNKECRYARYSGFKSRYTPYTDVQRQPIYIDDEPPQPPVSKNTNNEDIWKKKYLAEKSLNEKLIKMLPNHKQIDLTTDDDDKLSTASKCSTNAVKISLEKPGQETIRNVMELDTYRTDMFIDMLSTFNKKTECVENCNIKILAPDKPIVIAESNEVGRNVDDIEKEIFAAVLKDENNKLDEEDKKIFSPEEVKEMLSVKEKSDKNTKEITENIEGKISPILKSTRGRPKKVIKDEIEKHNDSAKLTRGRKKSSNILLMKDSEEKEREAKLTRNRKILNTAQNSGINKENEEKVISKKSTRGTKPIDVISLDSDKDNDNEENVNLPKKVTRQSKVVESVAQEFNKEKVSKEKKDKKSINGMQSIEKLQDSDKNKENEENIKYKFPTRKNKRKESFTKNTAAKNNKIEKPSAPKPTRNMKTMDAGKSAEIIKKSVGRPRKIKKLILKQKNKGTSKIVNRTRKILTMMKKINQKAAKRGRPPSKSRPVNSKKKNK